MKKLVVLMLGVLLIGSIAFTGKPTKNMTPAKVRTVTGTEMPIHRTEGAVKTNSLMSVPAAGDSIAWTYYDYPSNGCTKSNIFYFETGEVYVIRMARSNDWTTGPNNRGTYVKFFDGSDWSAGWDPVDNATAAHGFTDGGVFEDGTGWSMSHAGNVFSKDAAFGAMSWTPGANNGDASIWPVAYSVGDDTVFTVTSLSGGVADLSHMVFMRTFDGGATWSNPVRIDSLVTNPYGKEHRTAEGYAVAAFHNHVYAVNASYTSTTDNTCPLGIINLYESHDYGTTWTRREINPAITAEPVPVGTTEERAYIDPYAEIDPAGNLHVLWTTLTRINDGTNDNYYFTDDNKIMHWSDATGAVPVVGVPAGTAAYANTANNDVNVGYLGAPSCAFDGAGNMIVIYQRVSEPNDTAVGGFSYYQIYGVGSPDNGANWYEPVNLTNSFNYDNQYASVAPKIHADGKVWIVYNSDPYVGNYLQGSQLEEIGTAVKVYSFDKSVLLSVDGNEPVANNFSLKQNYPNPFNPTTTIEYDVKNGANVTLKVYNLLGQEVRTLVNTRQNAGNYKVNWDGKDNAGNAVASGVYLYRLEAGNVKLAKKMMLMK